MHHPWQRILFLCFLHLFLGFTLVEETLSASLTFSQQVMNRYVGVAGIPPHDSEVLWTHLHGASESGFYGGVYFFTDLGDVASGEFSSTRGDEADWYLGWKGQVVAGWSLKLQLVYLDLLELMDGRKGDTYRLIIEGEKTFTLSNHKLSPYGGVWLHQPAKGERPERGVHLVTGLRHAWSMAEGITLNQQAEIRRDDGFSGLLPATLYRHEASFAWKINDLVTFRPLIIQYSTPLTTTRQRTNEWVIGGGYALNF
ncbi:MAG: hypothetical protein G8345_12435 [Magnetococcales bacterium]|nr:hypothetical protein [Magnetococcales bacterium]NGZ27681.1 hypothetical protein [Magnetococcales bacterium]